ncbi:MAG: hypothetical protein NC453_16335 [Muribaculum sp.]|nr:hypothetical protein [Muribaculum sp.]
MTKAELEARVKELEAEVKRLKEFEGKQIVESEKDAIWRNETLRMLQHRSIHECTDEFFGYKRLVGDEFEAVVANPSYKEICKNDCKKRTFYKNVDTEYMMYGYIDEGNYSDTFSATVFAVSPGKKKFDCVLCFSELKTLITARLALAILFIMLDRNECSITRMHSPSLLECITHHNSLAYVLGTYRTTDDKYHFGVIAQTNADGTNTYDTYYFKKARKHFPMVGQDVDFADMVRALACLTSAAKEASGEIEVEDDDENMFYDLFNRFG